MTGTKIQQYTESDYSDFKRKIHQVNSIPPQIKEQLKDIRDRIDMLIPQINQSKNQKNKHYNFSHLEFELQQAMSSYCSLAEQVLNT